MFEIVMLLSFLYAVICPLFQRKPPVTGQLTGVKRSVEPAIPVKSKQASDRSRPTRSLPSQFRPAAATSQQLFPCLLRSHT